MSWNYRDDDEDKKRKGREEFPFDIFGHGGMFADEMIAKFLKEIQRAMQNPDQNGPGFSKKGFGPFITGYSITKGPDGKPIVKRFGNVDPSKMGLPMKP
ncbi:MAG: hypothetical protein GF308_00380 [Candidatus Heimdallarchaeota archaeon]|nr:hypothetical protein [Candidatus Heimdallarchaeota archaeon]